MTSSPGPIRRARRIRRRLTDVPFATVLALVGVNAAINFFARPGTQAASLLASPLAYAWVAMYGAGGALIVAGIAAARINVEALGCVAFGTGAAVSGLATAAVRGWAQWNAAAVLFVFAAGAWVRAYHLFRGRVLVLLDVESGTLRDGGR